MTATDHPTAGHDLPVATRNEALWAGGFGQEYLERNADVAGPRAAFWDDFVARYPAERVLEVGCTQGDNLVRLARHVPAHEVW